MDIKYTFRDEEAVQALKERFPDIFQRNMVLAAKVSTRDVQKTARAKHRFRSRSGNLELAIDTDVQVTSDNEVIGVVQIDPNSPGGAYGPYVHDGTPPHIIRHRNKQWLRWPDGAGFRFAKMVKHPGTKPDQFIYEAGEANQQHINDVFNRYADKAIKEAGL